MSLGHKSLLLDFISLILNLTVSAFSTVALSVKPRQGLDSGRIPGTICSYVLQNSVSVNDRPNIQQ